MLRQKICISEGNFDRSTSLRSILESPVDRGTRKHVKEAFSGDCCFFEAWKHRMLDRV